MVLYILKYAIRVLPPVVPGNINSMIRNIPGNIIPKYFIIK